MVTEKIWVKKRYVCKAAAKFDASMYVFRPAVVVLALHDGPDWLPRPLSPPAK